MCQTITRSRMKGNFLLSGKISNLCPLAYKFGSIHQERIILGIIERDIYMNNTAKYHSFHSF